jgi:predicted NUDIX family NTP pyrophosphohydrolase
VTASPADGSAEPARRAGRHSAGLLVFRGRDEELEVLLGHMGGPFWARRDAGAWSLPKGEPEPGEDLLAAARREFEEELGLPAPPGHPHPLGEIRQSGGKVVTAWAVEGDLDPDLVVPGTFSMEWPRGSGTVRSFPEVDRVAWLDLRSARERLVTGQRAFLDRLREHLEHRPDQACS